MAKGSKRKKATKVGAAEAPMEEKAKEQRKQYLAKKRGFALSHKKVTTG